MAGSRTLKLSILGDVDNLNKSLKTATNDVETFGDKMGKVGKVVGAAFAAAAAAAGAYAIKIGVEGVKAAIEDEKAQTQLALALENATGATKAQIAATEDSILQMSLATGVADDQLRPALAALSKGFDGNTAALGKLGIGLSAAELKTMSFTQVQDKLTELFGGAAAKNAETYSGRIARLQVAFDEAKETIGFALLPILEKLIRFINDNALPIINAFSGAFSLNGNGLGGVITTLGNVIVNTFTPIINGLIKAFGYVKDAIGDNADTFREFGALIATYVAPVIGTVLGGALQLAGKIAGGVIDVIAGVVKILNGLISGAVAGINALISAYNAIPFLPNVGKITTPTVSVPTIQTPTVSTSVGSIPSISVPSGGGTTISGGGGVSTAAKVAATAASAATNVVSGSFNAGTFRQAEAASMGTTINLTVTGAFDKEGTARTIVETLNNSFYRGTGGATNLQIA